MPTTLPLLYYFADVIFTSDILATAEATLQDPTFDDLGKGHAGQPSGHFKQHSKPSGSNHNKLKANNDFTGSEDEFLDEDIDDREEEIAEEASQKVYWSRFAQYVIYVMMRRLGYKCHSIWLPLSGYVGGFLPVPLTRSRQVTYSYLSWH